MDQSNLLKNISKESVGEDFQRASAELPNNYNANVIKKESYKLIDPMVVYKAIQSHNKAKPEDQKDWKEYLIKNEK
jgi:hypothetical protein